MVHKMKKKKVRGFTLIELIVVIAILGILAAIVIPRLGAFRDNAEKRALEADIRIMKSAAQMYIAGAEEGIPEAGITFTSDSHAGIKQYIEEWPEDVTSVRIEANGDITTVPVGPSASASPSPT